MKIQRIDNSIILEIPQSIDPDILNRFIEYAEGKMILETSKAEQEDIVNLADEINSEWWLKNKEWFLGQNEINR